MRLPRIALVAAAVLAVAACSSASPGWTYAPASPTSAPASAAASAGASASPAASGEASGSSAASGSPAASGGSSGGTALKVTAQNIAFDPTSLQASANTAFQIAFDNQDQGIPHNIDIKNSSGSSVFKGDLVTGPSSATYSVPALPAGDYTFVCDVHPNMTGTLSVK